MQNISQHIKQSKEVVGLSLRAFSEAHKKAIFVPRNLTDN